jgi:hypothetical protein
MAETNGKTPKRAARAPKTPEEIRPPSYMTCGIVVNVLPDESAQYAAFGATPAQQVGILLSILGSVIGSAMQAAYAQGGLDALGHLDIPEPLRAFGVWLNEEQRAWIAKTDCDPQRRLGAIDATAAALAKVGELIGTAAKEGGDSGA